MLIRAEEESETTAINELIRVAFESKAFSDGTEQFMLDQLRADNALSLSLVAIQDQRVVGQVCFSPAEISGDSDHWFTLGPIAVIPELQGQGIGTSLIEQGVRQLVEMGAKGCILTGDPRYYSRHGFELSAKNCPENESEQHFQVRLFGNERPVGRFSFHPVFSA